MLNPETTFLTEFTDRLKSEAASKNIELSEDLLTHYQMAALSTAVEKGIPNSATITEFARQAIQRLESTGNV
ncbi:MAG TPA: hypothetical protein V6C57_21470 [Coleofasciculaceae cyanobacterium]